MRRLITKITLAIISSVISIFAVYVLLSVFHIRFTDLAYDAFYVIEKAGHNSGRSAVILGDSVCKQLWPQETDSPNLAHLSSTAGISPAGNYLLLEKYVKHNPQTKYAYYAMNPGSLGADLTYAYQYFVIPFVNDETIKLLDDDTTQMLYDTFGKLFVRNKYVKTFLLNNNLFMKQYLNHIKGRSEATEPHRLSRTAIISLTKMRELCRERNIKLSVIPLPIADKPENYGWDKFAQDVKDNGLDDILGDFVNKIRYYPEDWYRDGVHFKPKILNEHLEELRALVID